MVLLFLRDWRSVIVVVLNIPLALCGALVALWLTGQTINLMTLGGLALAVGILVDEATVEVENIHTQMCAHRVDRPGRAAGQPGDGRAAAAGDALHPGGVRAVVLHAGGRPRLFVPLSLAVGFAMIATYLLSSTFVPVLSVWLLKSHPEVATHKAGRFERFLNVYEAVVARVVHFRYFATVIYLAAAA